MTQSNDSTHLMQKNDRALASARLLRDAGDMDLAPKTCAPSSTRTTANAWPIPCWRSWGASMAGLRQSRGALTGKALWPLRLGVGCCVLLAVVVLSGCAGLPELFSAGARSPPTASCSPMRTPTSSARCSTWSRATRTRCRTSPAAMASATTRSSPPTPMSTPGCPAPAREWCCRPASCCPTRRARASC